MDVTANLEAIFALRLALLKRFMHLFHTFPQVLFLLFSFVECTGGLHE